MPNVKIKQLNDRVASSGVHFGMGPLVRKLEPSEVVALEGELFEMIYGTDKVEITNEKITRPLKYDSELEAKYCSPSFRPLDPSQETECIRAREAVAERLAYKDKMKRQTSAGLQKANEALRKKKAEGLTKREERLQKLKEMQDGEANTT